MFRRSEFISADADRFRVRVTDECREEKRGRILT
jgi:hypothetical protein